MQTPFWCLKVLIRTVNNDNQEEVLAPIFHSCLVLRQPIITYAEEVMFVGWLVCQDYTKPMNGFPGNFIDQINFWCGYG